MASRVAPRNCPGPSVAVHRRHRRGRPRRAGRGSQDAISPRPNSYSAASVIWGLPPTSSRANRVNWPSPFDAAMRDLTALRGRRVCVLASGDPFLHGVGATIARLVPADEMTVIPGAFRLQPGGRPARLAAGRDRDGVAARQAGRAAAPAASSRAPGDRADIGRERPAAVAATARGERVRRFDDDGAGGAGRRSRTHPQRPRRRLRARRASIRSTSWRSKSTASRGRAHPAAGARPRRRRCSSMTARSPSAKSARLTLSALAPRRGELLWDIGAGAGSVAIEWMLADPSLRAIAIESDRDRAARIRRNASALGVPGLAVVEGAAPAALRRPAAPACDLHRRRRQRRRRARCGNRCACLGRTAGRQCGDAGDGGDPARPSCQARRRPRAHRRVARRAGRLDAWLAAGHAGHAMVMGEAMIVAGIGSRKGVAADGGARGDRRRAGRAWPVARPDRPARHRPAEARRAGAAAQPARAIGRELDHRRRRSAAGGVVPDAHPLRAFAGHGRRAVGVGSLGARRGRAGAAACSVLASCSAPSPAPSQSSGDTP